MLAVTGTNSHNPGARSSCQAMGLFTRYVKLRVTHAPGMPGTFSPPPWASDPDMHHGTCVTHVPWCMPISLTSGFLWHRCRENVPGIPGACASRNFPYLVRGPLQLVCCSGTRTFYLRVPDLWISCWDLMACQRTRKVMATEQHVPVSHFIIIWHNFNNDQSYFWKVL